MAPAVGLRGSLTGAPGPYWPVSILSGPAAERPRSPDAGRNCRPIKVIWKELTTVLERRKKDIPLLTVASTAARVDARRVALSTWC